MSYIDEVKVGQIYNVGEFFWVDDIIGYSSDAQHGHGSFDGGSADTDCTVRVLDVSLDGLDVIVVLMRSEIPYGAPAAIGTIFKITTARMLSWRDIISEQADIDNRNAQIMGRLGIVRAAL